MNKAMISNKGIQYVWRQIFQRLGFEYAENYFLVGDKKIGYSYKEKAVQQDNLDYFINIQPCEKKAFETIFGIIIFAIIMIILFTSGVFLDIIEAFNVPEFNGFGLLLGIIFVIIIIVAFLEKILGK